MLKTQTLLSFCNSMSAQIFLKHMSISSSTKGQKGQEGIWNDIVKKENGNKRQKWQKGIWNENAAALELSDIE